MTKRPRHMKQVACSRSAFVAFQPPHQPRRKTSDGASPAAGAIPIASLLTDLNGKPGFKGHAGRSRLEDPTTQGPATRGALGSCNGAGLLHIAARAGPRIALLMTPRSGPRVGEASADATARAGPLEAPWARGGVGARQRCPGAWPLPGQGWASWRSWRVAGR